MAEAPRILLEHHLKRLKLPTFLREYEKLARQCAAEGLDHVQFLARLVELELIDRERRLVERRIEMSSRPATGNSTRCRNRPSARLGHLATGFAIRRGIDYRRNTDLKALGMGKGFQRWGTDITVSRGGRQLRLLSVHLTSRCWGAGEDRTRKRRRICDTLRGQMSHLKDWADARRAEGTPFVILGDFNRRLALKGDWAWRLLSPPRAPLRLLTSRARSHCDRRYPAFIDHLVAGGGAEGMLVPGSFRELPRRGPHPDHCAISAALRVGN